jgi:hypothetical protein
MANWEFFEWTVPRVQPRCGWRVSDAGCEAPRCESVTDDPSLATGSALFEGLMTAVQKEAS